MVRVPGLNKRAWRIDLQRPPVLINSDGVELDVTILDVSNGGFRLGVLERVRIFQTVTLRVERDEQYPAQIRWVLGGEAGGVFLALANYSDWYWRELRRESLEAQDPLLGLSHIVMSSSWSVCVAV
jgi:hypothetical protein